MARSYVPTEVSLDDIDAYFGGHHNPNISVIECKKVLTSTFDSTKSSVHATNATTVYGTQRTHDDARQTAYVSRYQSLEEHNYRKAHSYQKEHMDEQAFDDDATLNQLETRSTTSCATAVTAHVGAAKSGFHAGDSAVFKNYGVKAFTYDDKLPITQNRAKVLETIEANQVTVIRGSTGSGKTTQVPQYILEHCALKEKTCNIIVTQPRRIAAISVARRVCQERSWPLGTLCGYQVGMDRKTCQDTRLCYVTTGVLLQKLINTKNMHDYTHVILDEVHERDQNTDLVLLIVRKLLRSNSRSTKVVLMSATFDCELFATYFSTLLNGQLTPAPIISVEGRIYDVAEHYLEDVIGDRLLPAKLFEISEPSIKPEVEKIAVELVEHFDEMETKDQGVKPMTGFAEKRGTVLVFLPGLAEIQSLEAILNEATTADRRLRIIPLHSTITAEEQARAFDPAPPGMRKVILSTNIAESSVTVPDIKYVIDFCLTKNLMCDTETNYMSLKLEWASKANCTQRKGRAGRVSNGKVYRLVMRRFYLDMIPDYSVPEMLRCPLEMLILQVKLLDLGEPKAILALALSPPRLDNIERSILFLKEVGALSTLPGVAQNPHDGRLTYVGRVLAHLPVDVRLGKLIVFGHVFGLLEECLIVAASLSARTVFARPFYQQLEAYGAKMEWALGSASDCIASLNAFKEWDRLHKSGFFRTARNRETTWCHQKLLQRNRLNEVADVVTELQERLKAFNIRVLRLPPHTRQQREPVHDALLLKILFAAAFYPNYFTCGASDEKFVDKAISGKNCFNTVVLRNIPMNQGILYAKDLERLMKQCDHNPTLSFEESRAYVEFSKASATPYSTKVHPGVYMAVKMRQLRMPLTLNLWGADEARTRMQKLYSIQANLAAQSNKLRTNKVRHGVTAGNIGSVGADETSPVQVALPDASTKEVAVAVTHIVDCGHFWVHYVNEATMSSIYELHMKIRELIGKAKVMPVTALKKGTLCLAPFCDESGDEQYYRARVESVIQTEQPGGIEVQVFFPDYGNTSRMNAAQVRCPPPDVMGLSFQAVECQLAGIRPSLLKTESGTQWSEEARQAFRELVLGKASLVCQIYSVVGGVMRVDLIERHPSGHVLHHVNQFLVDRCLADRARESHQSEQNHKLREEEMQSLALGSTVRYASARAAHSASQQSQEWDKMDLNVDSFAPRRGPKISLTGPHSPLEMSFYSLTSTGRMRAVTIERESVNSVSLNSEPQDYHERLMVAASVSVNQSGSMMQARNTTLLPNIHGLPALLSILFAPTVELRTDPNRRSYTGALCGLGQDVETNCPALPDHDMEITFDTKFDVDDIMKINAVRLAVNVALGTNDGFIPLSDDMILKIQDNARSKILELLEKRRESVDRRPFEQAYTWNMVEPADLLELTEELRLSSSECLLNLIRGIHLNVKGDDDERKTEDEELRTHRQYLIEHSKWLWKKAEQRSAAREDILCELCNKVCRSTKELSAHLSTRTHKEEELILF